MVKLLILCVKRKNVCWESRRFLLKATRWEPSMFWHESSSWSNLCLFLYQLTLSGWWLNQPLWKICSSNWIISQSRDDNKTCLKPPPSCGCSYTSWPYVVYPSVSFVVLEDFLGFPPAKGHEKAKNLTQRRAVLGAVENRVPATEKWWKETSINGSVTISTH